MRITWLLEVADQLWGGVKVALENANWLHRAGHQVTVVSRSGPPRWMQLDCAFQQVQDFHAEHLPDGDVVIGTFWTTVPWAASAGPQKGVPVHFCQGYEGDNPENAALRERIEAVYRLRGVQHITIAPHLTRLLRERLGVTCTEVPYAIDHTVHHAAPPRAPGTPLRVGLVGPYQIAWKDLPTGYEACRLAHRAGQPLILVRATNTAPDPAEQATEFPVEWHHRLPPAKMGDFYRSLDVLLATSRGAEEGFFLPAIEAMANGVPVVLTDVPCFRGHGDTDGRHDYGLFVPPGDPGAMAEALVVAGRMPDVRAALRREGLALAARYTQERHGRALEAALRQFAGLPAAAPTTTAERTPLRLVASPLAEAPQLADLQQRLADAAAACIRNGAPADAARCLAALLCFRPTDATLRGELGAALQAAGDHAAALREYDELQRQGVDDEVLHTARGHALHALGRMLDAAQAFRAALAVGVRTADAYNRLGVVLFQAGDVAGARRNFEAALVLQPGHGDAVANLAALPAA